MMNSEIHNLNRALQPPIHDAVAFNLELKPYEHFTLDNGVPVYAVNAGSQEVIMFEWVFYAGNWYEDKNNVAAATNYLIKNGTRQKTAFDINEHFDFYGAYLNRVCQHETASITLHCLSKHVNELLPVVSEILTESVFSEIELSIYKQNQKQHLQVNLMKCDFVANRLIDEYLYGFNHPYGKYTSAQDYDALEREELVRFYEQFYVNGKCLLFVAGRLSANLQQQLNKNFGSLPLNNKPLPEVHHTPKPVKEKKYTILNDPNGVQGAIRIASPFPNKHHPDFIKTKVLNNILGGYFSSRLMRNIREEKGYTYGIHSFLQDHIHECAWMISTEAGRDVCTATVEEIYKEMKKLCEEPVEENELNLVRNHLVGGVLSAIDGPFHIIARWKNYILHGVTDDYFYKNLQTFKTITAQDLLEMANKYLQPPFFYELVVI